MDPPRGRFQDYWCTNTVLTISSYSSLLAIAGAQIETAMFLKTLNVNTMMTNTAAKIILVMLIIAIGMGIITTAMVLSSSKNVCQTETYCEIYTIFAYHATIPPTLVFLIVFAVMGFTVFRTQQFKKKRDINSHQKRFRWRRHKTEGRNDDVLNMQPSQGQGRLFTIQEAVSKLDRQTEENQETHRGIIIFSQKLRKTFQLLGKFSKLKS